MGKYERLIKVLLNVYLSYSFINLYPHKLCQTLFKNSTETENAEIIGNYGSSSKFKRAFL